MLAVRGRIQREGDVVHLASSVTDLSEELASVGRLNSAFPCLTDGETRLGPWWPWHGSPHPAEGLQTAGSR